MWIKIGLLIYIYGVIIKTEHMFERLGVVELDTKKEIVNYFMEAYIYLESDAEVEVAFEMNGVLGTMITTVEKMEIENNIFIMNIEKGNLEINLKKYKVNILEDEGVLTLQLKNENNEIRISI